MGDEVVWTADEQELIDFLAEAVSASLYVDWQPRDAALSIIAAMHHEGLCFARTDAKTEGWTKAELEKWARGLSRTPATVLKAFIDAGLCSDQAPSREETRLPR
ncbi:hypothetical protein [Qipengyuania sp. MTN3-11]|uniref:hypothetical protein n=1 Tax=Qipengyuania sp. MTN3-11 TaxID=3056557 RepID=UPI0036F2FAF2